MALNTWERDTLAEIKERTLRGEYVSPLEKQLVLDLLKREQLMVRAEVVARAAAEGLDTRGIQTSMSNAVIQKRNGGVRPMNIDDIGGCSANYR